MSTGSAEAPPKLNALPHEVQVVVTGARPGRSSENRELFTETTTTVVVFENGAVIRLGAAVKPGQLLFVTHPKFKHEVIAQVTRKRDSRPSSCYVELEFSEPFPDFWGVKFPKTPEPASVTPAQTKAEEMVQASDVTEDEPLTPTLAPSGDEVLKLKKEVETLRSKLKQVETQAVPAKAESTKERLTEEDGVTPTRTSSATELTEAEEALLPKVSLDFGTAPVAAAIAKSRQPEGATTSVVARRSKLPAILSIAAVLMLGIGVAYLKHWIPGRAQGRQSAGISAPSATQNSLAPSNVSAAPPTSVPTSSSVSATAAHETASEPASSKLETPSLQNQIVPSIAAPSVAPAATGSPVQQHAVASENVAAMEPNKIPSIQLSIAAKPAALSTVSKRTIIRAPVESNTVAVSDGSDAAGFSAPKLVKASRPNSPAEALQGFISGNVVLDAVVDPAGHVKSTKIISGPEKLRKAALEAIHDYKYEPAMQNGKPVPAHVNVTIQFWYEP